MDSHPEPRTDKTGNTDVHVVIPTATPAKPISPMVYLGLGVAMLELGRHFLEEGLDQLAHGRG